MVAGIRGTMRNVSTAAMSVTRLAAVAISVKCVSWASKGPAGYASGEDEQQEVRRGGGRQLSVQPSKIQGMFLPRA